MITGFRLVGIGGVEVNTIEEARTALNKVLTNVDVAIIIISEKFSSKMHDEINELRSNRISPLIVEIPGRKGPTGETRMSNLISRSLGIKL